MGIQASGLGSGIDSKALIAQLIDIERQPIRMLDEKRSGFQAQVSKVGKITAALKTLQTKLKALDTQSEVMLTKGVSSNEAAFAITAKSNAPVGSYAIEVQQVAKEEKDRSVGFANGQAAVKAGTVSFAVKGGAAQVVTIAEGDSLETVAANITKNVKGVSAAVITAAGQTFLQLTALEAGHAVGGSPSDAIVITENSTGATGTALAFTETQVAQTAKLTIDGLAVESDKNDITTALPGVTISVKDLTTKAEKLTISVDRDAMVTKVKELVDAYNAAMDLVRAETTVSATTDRKASLAGDPTIRALEQMLKSKFSSPVTSLGSASIAAAANFGVTSDRVTGKMSVDTTKLQTALVTDAQGVVNVLTAADGLATRLAAAIDGYAGPNGSLQARTEGLNSSVKQLDKQKLRLEDRVAKLQEQLTRQFTALETSVSALKNQQQYLASALPST